MLEFFWNYFNVSTQGQERRLRGLVLRQPRPLALLLGRRPLLPLHDDPHHGGREHGHQVGGHQRLLIRQGNALGEERLLELIELRGKTQGNVVGEEWWLEGLRKNTRTSKG